MLVATLLFFLVVAFLPPLAFAAWVRHGETHQREPLGAVMRVFFLGAVVSVVVALILEVAVDARWRETIEGTATLVPYAVFAAVVVAPVAEEFAKALSILGARDRHPEPEDGFVYGAAAGLGFAATENLVYHGVAFATGGVAGYAASVVVRTVASTLLHASASAWAGYGLLRWRSGHASFVAVPLFLGLAMLMHGAFNLLASVNALLALVAAAALSVTAFRGIRKRVRRHDAVVA